MKKARKLITIVMISLLVLFVMLFADIVILGYLSIETDHGMSQPSVGLIAEQLEKTTNTDTTYSLSVEGKTEAYLMEIPAYF